MCACMCYALETSVSTAPSCLCMPLTVLCPLHAGSAADTFLMILVPLFTTANLVRGANVWSYMAFGSLYANWLTLIHSEYAHPWDGAFRMLGLGTAADHHIHHALFVKNYGHLFMYFDWLCGTYKNPATCSKFNARV